MQRHGLTIGIERVNEEFFLTLKATGKLTHEDYEVITPMLDGALAAVENPRIKAFIDATELQGWEARAAWDDFRLGVKHGRQFAKVAILGNKKWQSYAAKLASWFVSGEVQYFEDAQSAEEWLATDS